jgi:pyruvate kinase
MCPVERMRQYNTGDPPGVDLEKRYDAIWEVRAHDARELALHESTVHSRFAAARTKRDTGNFTEWFRIDCAEVAEFIDAKFLCVFTESGDSARRMSRLRSSIPMLVFTPHEAIRRRMALIWGVRTFLVEPVTHTDAMFVQVDDYLLGEGLAQVGDKVVVIAGTPPGIAGSTNDLRVHLVGDAHGGAAEAYANHS